LPICETLPASVNNDSANIKQTTEIINFITRPNILTGGQRHNNETTFELIGLTSRPSFLRFKKIKTPPPHEKKLNFYCHHTNGTFGFAPPHKANPSGKPKEPFLPNAPIKNVTCGIEI
jgi:hypothetical protein